VGSAIAAELGTMQVSEQVDQLRTLGSDPVDYLVVGFATSLTLPHRNISVYRQWRRRR